MYICVKQIFTKLYERSVTALMPALAASSALSARPGYIPSEEVIKARSEFQDEKFGIMICRSICSMMGDGITLCFPSVPEDDIDYIVELTFADTI